MSPTLKRILLLVGFTLLVILIGFGLYTLFFKSSTAPSTSEGETATTSSGTQFPGSSGRPTTGGGGTTSPTSSLSLSAIVGTSDQNQPTYFQAQPVKQLTSDFSTFTSLSSNGSVRYYNQADGKFYRISANGTPQLLADQVFYNAQKVTWAKAQDKAVIEYPDGSKIVYDFERKRQITLPSHWQDFSFSADGSEIAAKTMGLSPDNRWLIVTKDDGTGTQAIEPLGDNGDKVTVDWSPSQQTLALSRTGAPQGGERQEVLFVGMNHENFKSTVVEGLDFQPQWSPTGKELLYSIDNVTSDFKPDLWIVDSYGDDIGSNRRQIQLNTWANKCSFGDDTTLFCAVPQDLPEGAGMSPEIAKDTPDLLYKIDLKTGVKNTIPLDSDYTIDSISYDKNTNKVFFTDPHRSGIFQVNI